MRKLLPVCIALALASCKAGGDMGAAEDAVAAFHRDYDAQRFAALFDKSSPVLKELTPRPQFIEFISATRRKLGPVKSTGQTGWHVDYDTGGSQVTLTYETTFANGEGTETFVYDTADPPRLMGYYISAPEVVVR